MAEAESVGVTLRISPVDQFVSTGLEVKRVYPYVTGWGGDHGLCRHVAADLSNYPTVALPRATVRVQGKVYLLAVDDQGEYGRVVALSYAPMNWDPKGEGWAGLGSKVAEIAATAKVIAAHDLSRPYAFPRLEGARFC